ncbi:MAG: hypothetical protein JKY50_00765 [Oleispira sp.]|nr:hypothetical protein [Oleispira sp.]
MDIKFRGISVASGKIIYGYYVFSEFGADGPSHVLIGFDGFGHRVIKKETLGQFTGLTDPSGVEVYAGDRIKYPGCKSIATVVFKDGCFIAHHDFIKRDPELLRRAVGTEETEGHAVVIGNIHQHSHLLDKGE